MRKIILILLVLSIIFSGCSRQPAALLPTPTPAPPTPTPAAEFYTRYMAEPSRPIAVMIDNDDKNAWPHSGLRDAYMIYEMYVEGNSTRLMALFKNAEADRIGPVRSSRHYFLDYALEHDAIYVHFGWSPKAAQDISALKVNNINGVTGTDGKVFWRDRKYRNDWHSAYTSTENILKMAIEKGYRTESDIQPLKMNRQDISHGWPQLTALNLPYAGFYKVSYEYDAEKGAYLRYLNGKPHELYDGTHLAAKNIIIAYVKNRPLGDGSPRQDFDTVGSGKGYFLTMGEYIPITWEKSSRTARTVYKDETGSEITLNPGQTWVQLIPPQMQLSLTAGD